MKNLIVHLTGRKISKDQTRLFLESIDENNDALIQRQELVDFVTTGINLSKNKRQKYAKRSKLHSIILDFFDVCKKNLQLERETLHVEVKLTSSEEDERLFIRLQKLLIRVMKVPNTKDILQVLVKMKLYQHNTVYVLVLYIPRSFLMPGQRGNTLKKIMMLCRTPQTIMGPVILYIWNPYEV